MSLGTIAGGLCLLICGESGVGKSTLVQWLIRQLKVSRDEQGLARPAIYVEIPTNPTAIGVFESLLSALGDPKPSHGTRTVKRRRLVNMLREQGVRLLVLDDLQHIVDRQSDRVLFDASEAVKEVLIEHPMSVLCAGLADAERVVKSNEQLSRRHMATVRLQRFDWGKEPSKKIFLGTLKAFQASMTCYDLPDLQHKSVALRFYLATGGIMDFMFKLFLFTAEIALKRNLTSIRLDVFDEAWGRAFLHSEGSERPLQEKFDPDIDTRVKLERALSINAPPPVFSPRKKGANDRLRRVGL